MASRFATAAVLLLAVLATTGMTTRAADSHDGDTFGVSGTFTAFEPEPQPRDQLRWPFPGARRDHDDEDSDSDRRGRRGARRGDDEDSDSEGDRRRGRFGTRDRGRDNRGGVSQRGRINGPRGARTGSDIFDRGFDAGYDAGFRDGRNGGRYDPTRHEAYRSGGGSRSRSAGSDRQVVYRDGFRYGYERGYRDGEDARRTTRGRFRLPWPF